MDDNQKLQLLSIGEASDYLGVSIDTLRRWEKRGRIIPFRSPGGHRYYKKNELDELFGKRYTHDEHVKENDPEPPRLLVEEHTIGQNTDGEKVALSLQESPILETKTVQIPQHEPIKVSQVIEPLDVPPPPPSLPVEPIAVVSDAPRESENLELASAPVSPVEPVAPVVEYVAPPVPSPQESFLIPKVETQQSSPPAPPVVQAVTAPQGEQPQRISRLQKKEKKEAVTMVIIVCILLLVIILGIVLFIMLFRSSNNVLSPSP